MKITGISFRPISIPYRIPWRNRHTEEHGAPMTHLQTSILELSTDEGITGLGEVRGVGVSQDEQDGIEHALIGQDPRQISSLIPMLEGRFGQGPFVAGVDFALHDIKARALGVPVYELLGGKFRERVPLVWTLPYLDIEDQVLQAQQMVQEGFTHAIKIKVGVPGDSEHIRAVAKAIGDVPIRPDSNRGHSKSEALRQLRELQAEGVNYELIEDPCPTNMKDYQEIGDALGRPLSVHGGIESFNDVMNVIRADAPAVQCMNVMITHFGLYRASQIVGALQIAGIGWTLGTSHDSSIKMAAGFHLATAMSNTIYPCDLLGPRLHVDDIAAQPLHIKAGYGVAPDSPGLGIELNEDVMGRWAGEESAVFVMGRLYGENGSDR
jgi:L-alanine-DL-glutamate epimerase-like enolase superfamily enzyme